MKETNRHCEESEGRRSNLGFKSKIASSKNRTRNDSIIALFLTLFSFSGCTVWQPLRKPPQNNLPGTYQGYYDYSSPDLAAKIVREKVTKHYILRTLEFPLTLPPELQVKDLDAYRLKNEELFKTDQKTANDLALRYTVRIDYYVPKNLKPGQKRPAILISPILGGNMVVDHFARYYAGRGFVAAIVYRKRLFWQDERTDMQQFEDYLRTSIIRLREAVDWLSAQPEVDAGRIGSFGVSYGAILHTVLAAVEPRIRYHVLAMPAGPISEVIVHCPDKAVTKLIKHAEEHYGWTIGQIEKDMAATVKTDPVLMAPYVPREKIEVYVSLFDRVVGAGRSFRLWKALGKPKLRILPFGHYGGIMVFPYLETQSYLALKKHLK